MKNRKLLWGLIALVVAAALLWGAYTLWMPKGEMGNKEISFQVVHSDGQSKAFTLHTEEAYLRHVLEAEKLIEGEESEYGLFVLTVDGYTAQSDQQEWWCFTKGGETVTTGVDTTPIANGDRFEATLTVGY